MGGRKDRREETMKEERMGYREDNRECCWEIGRRAWEEGKEGDMIRERGEYKGNKKEQEGDRRM